MNISNSTRARSAFFIALAILSGARIAATAQVAIDPLTLPADQVALVGGTAAFSAIATRAPPLFYV